MGRKITFFLINLIFKLVTRIKVIDIQNAPLDESFVMASNHIGRLDATIIFQFSQRQDIILIVAEKYRKIPLMPWFVKQINGIWVDRFNADFSAVRQVLSRLKNGGVLVLAPEGTRSPTGNLQKAWAGGSYLAAKAEVPIVPVALVGSEDSNVVAHMRQLKRTLITIRVGQAFRLPPLPKKDRDAALEAYTDEIMCRIAALLPAEKRGEYADHPRLKELLAEEPVLQADPTPG
jgi:1-acyl-sn-glycerol-3-phosphate acyltransferase